MRPVRSPIRSTIGFVICRPPRYVSALPNSAICRPSLQLALAPRLVEEHDPHPARAVADVDGHHRAAVAGRALRDRPHRDEHERLLTGHEVADPGLVRAVDPAPRVGGDQVEHRVDADSASAARRLSPTPLSCSTSIPASSRSVIGGRAFTARAARHLPTPKRYGYSGWPPRWTSTWTSGAAGRRPSRLDRGVSGSAGYGSRGRR